MKYTLISGLMLFMSSSAFCQQNVVTTGGDASSASGSMAYTIGQIDYINTDNGTNNTNQGVQQPIEFFSDVGIEESFIITSLYPNPTADEVNLILPEHDGIELNLYDSKGKIIKQIQPKTNELTIDMSQLATGAYHLKVYKNDQQIELVKIIKH